MNFYKEWKSLCRKVKNDPKIRYAKIWGPSSKFAGQKIGLKHVVKDKDIVEFVTD